jgi:hypothetical protein
MSQVGIRAQVAKVEVIEHDPGVCASYVIAGGVLEAADEVHQADIVDVLVSRCVQASWSVITRPSDVRPAGRFAAEPPPTKRRCGAGRPMISVMPNQRTRRRASLTNEASTWSGPRRSSGTRCQRVRDELAGPAEVVTRDDAARFRPSGSRFRTRRRPNVPPVCWRGCGWLPSGPPRTRRWVVVGRPLTVWPTCWPMSTLPTTTWPGRRCAYLTTARRSSPGWMQRRVRVVDDGVGHRRRAAGPVGRPDVAAHPVTPPIIARRRDHRNGMRTTEPSSLAATAGPGRDRPGHQDQR